MPQLVLRTHHQAEWVEAPVPTLGGSGDALVRPIAVAACDLDSAINTGRFPLALPYAVGHEFTARVVEVAPDVTGVRPGDLVAVPFQISCGACRRCKQGLTGECAAVPRWSMFGHGVLGGDWGGAMSDLVRVPYADAMLVPLPDGVDPAAVASLDNLPDAWRTVGPYLRDREDRRVLVVGGYSVGLYAAAIARALGAEVTYVDHGAERMEVAERLGATVVHRTDRRPLGPFPVTVSTSATGEGLRRALDSTDQGGICTDTGIHLSDVVLPLRRMYTTGITLVTSRVAARRDLPAVLELVASGRLDPSVVTTDTVRWADAAEAWSANTAKLVVTR